MDISEAKTKYIFTTKIELDDGDYIVLREPTIAETKDFGDDNAKNFENMEKILPSCIIESSFTNADKPATGKEVYEFLKSSASLYSEALDIWMSSIPFKSRVTKTKK